MKNRIFFRYPALLFGVAAAIVLNDLFKFAPGQVNTGFVGIIIPAILVGLGVYATILNNKEKKDALNKKEDQ
ncbi:hypothetical protein H7F33_18765 [Pedobacter sp. PAMC26386]|nr:hypothetical protein H7F33_18765 [Pedobacter sp. PAMC26386]